MIQVGRFTRALVVAALSYVTYIVFSGSIQPYDLITGAVVACVVGVLFSNITISNPWKIAQPSRWFWLVFYAVKYFTLYEALAHIDVIKRILHPKTPVRPAIVKVPYEVSSDYAITATANSITNTPGTVVVEIREDEKAFYVHWIYAPTVEPEEARKGISLAFEEYSKRIFE
ncbi:MAG: Na+/H+ antiporter subunit E [Desulfurococcus sp.]|nr:Na+/H+ antiporter subunit E [Desulfurococcus sp.]